MRKTTKGFLSALLSAAMILTAGIVPGQSKSSAADGVALSDGGFTAYLCQNNSKIFDATEEAADDQAYGVVTSIKVTETGTYSLKGISIGDVDNLLEEGQYLGMQTNLTEFPKDYKIVAKEIRVNDGLETKVYDWSKATLYPEGGYPKATGKRYRIPVMNNYVSIKNKEFPYANPLATNVNGTATYDEPIVVGTDDEFELVFAVEEGGATEPDATPEEPQDATAQNKYHAYLSFQTDNWVFRDFWDNEDTGLNSKDIKYTSQIAISDATDDSDFKTKDATIVDAEITKNAEYKISISGVDIKNWKASDKDAEYGTQFNMLTISTDIPLGMKGVSIKDATLKIDGKEIKKYTTVPCKGDAAGYYQLMLADAYAPDDGTKGCPYVKGSELKTLPTDSIEVTFTVSGVSFDYKVVGKAKGKTFTSGNFKYKVTTACTSSGGKVTAGKVSVVGLTAAGKKAKTLSVPATVKKTGQYKVTAIGSKAFKSAKATSVTLNKNIKKIPASAFASCTKLSKLKINAKLTSVKKNAFKGCKKTIKVSGTSKAANVKKLKKSGYTSFK